MKQNDKNMDKKQQSTTTGKDGGRKAQQTDTPMRGGTGGDQSQKGSGDRGQSGGAQDSGQRRDR